MIEGCLLQQKERIALHVYIFQADKPGVRCLLSFFSAEVPMLFSDATPQVSHAFSSFVNFLQR